MVSFSFFKGPIRNYKYKSGAQKRKEKLRKEVLQKSQVGSLNKYFNTNNVDNFVVNDIENQFDIESNENEKTSSNVNENEELNQTVNENEKSSTTGAFWGSYHLERDVECTALSTRSYGKIVCKKCPSIVVVCSECFITIFYVSIYTNLMPSILLLDSKKRSSSFQTFYYVFNTFYLLGFKLSKQKSSIEVTTPLHSTFFIVGVFCETTQIGKESLRPIEKKAAKKKRQNDTIANLIDLVNEMDEKRKKKDDEKE
ncbi:hypothetical protein G4B88_012471 [Cannabis sativa]|uniref:Uncharacterized protein n=1 Tax=Cannabis sativa TaxID=3483 RepID=A0A7J6I5S8_CANSA|nr:hypothetical protein G4B88_012471 [Cannabis sativa]